jgi:hypothetical protein
MSDFEDYDSFDCGDQEFSQDVSDESHDSDVSYCSDVSDSNECYESILLQRLTDVLQFGDRVNIGALCIFSSDNIEFSFSDCENMYLCKR